MVQMSFYCVYILPQSYARVQFPKILRFLWEKRPQVQKRSEKRDNHFRSNPSTSIFWYLKSTKMYETFWGGRMHHNPTWQQKKLTKSP